MIEKFNNISAKTIDDITEFIFVSDKPVPADAIFVVGGSLPKAAEIAAELYKRGYSNKIFIGGKFSIKRDCFPIPEYNTEYDFYKDILIKNGICEEHIYGENESTYTKQNAEFARKIAIDNHFDIKKGLIVCKSFHAKRCLLFYQMYFPDTEFSVIPFDGFNVSRDNWHKTEYGIKRVLGEIERISKQVSPELIKDLLPFANL